MKTTENWFACEISVASEASEAVEFGLDEGGARGTEINHLGKKNTENITVIGYFDESPDDAKLCDNLNEALRIYGFAPEAIREIAVSRVADADWLAEWKKHWKPTETAKFIVAPPWENVAHSDKIVVRIEPNMAFGTGTHETTKLCLKAVEEHFQSGMSFLDVGTGTGILAIAAAKLDAEYDAAKTEYAGYDTDENSIVIAVENAELNDIAGINFIADAISDATAPADFVCANILPDVIIPILPLLLDKSKKVLVLSGILAEQQPRMVEELHRLNITNAVVETDGEWISIRVSR